MGKPFRSAACAVLLTITNAAWAGEPEEMETVADRLRVS